MTFTFCWSLFPWGREHCCPHSSSVGVVGDTQERTKKDGSTQAGLRRMQWSHPFSHIVCLFVSSQWAEKPRGTFFAH